MRRERSERRKLQRQLRKEERGAVRELRRDAAFMAGVRDREKAAKQAELDQSQKRVRHAALRCVMSCAVCGCV